MNVKFAWAALALAGCSSAATPLPEVPPTPASTLSQWQQPPPVAPEPDVTLWLRVPVALALDASSL